MKKVLLTIISVCLIAASIFGLFAGVSSISDIMNVKEYKEKDAEEGLESIDTLDAGLDQLQENEGTYLAGVDTYTAGLVSYSEGKSTLSAGYAAYYAGKKQLEEGKAAYAAGKKQIEDNTAAYNEGKATLAKIEPLMPYVDQYVEFRNGTISNLAGFSSAQAWFVSVVRPIAASKGLVMSPTCRLTSSRWSPTARPSSSSMKTVWPSWPRPKRPSPQARLSSETLKSSSLRAKWILPQAATSWPTAKSSSTPLKTAARRSLPAASFCSASPLT